ncbi:unnamed protein product [Rotaria sp. Silwood1]|nr:unnamed protein product [Rotaria sp. Silwood1]
MTPLEAITKTVDDPIESFVQIVLEKPDDKPPIMPPVPISPTHANSANRRRHRSSSPRLKQVDARAPASSENTTLPKLTQHQSMPARDLFDFNEKYCSTPAVVEPMDFSFLEPVLRGESAAPPPPPPLRNHSLSLLNNTSNTKRQISLKNSSPTEDSAIDSHTSSPSSCSSNHVTTIEDDLTSPESLTGDNHKFYLPRSFRSPVRPSMD